MTPKKKRTYFAVVNEDLEITGDDDGLDIDEDKERIKELCDWHKESNPKQKFKVLRVTLTASPAEWK